jgi:hypothetical protein
MVLAASGEVDPSGLGEEGGGIAEEGGPRAGPTSIRTDAAGTTVLASHPALHRSQPA